VRRRLGVAAAAALLVLAGCGGDDEPEPIGGDEAAPDEGADPTELDPEGDLDGDEGEEEEIDVTVVPDEITEDYVEAVLAELEQIRHDALVEFRENDGEMTIEVDDMVASIFTPEGTEYEAADLEIMRDRDFEGQRSISQLEPLRPQVDELISVSDDCVAAETTLSLDGLQEEPDPPFQRAYLLVVQERELVEDPNPTPWVIGFISEDVDHWREQDPCAE
jgi:hypothetical protein